MLRPSMRPRRPLSKSASTASFRAVGDADRGEHTPSVSAIGLTRPAAPRRGLPVGGGWTTIRTLDGTVSPPPWRLEHMDGRLDRRLHLARRPPGVSGRDMVPAP